MKKTFTLLLTAATALTLTACSGKTEEPVDGEGSEKTVLNQIKERGYLIIGTEGVWSPWTYHDENTDELTGFDVEVGREIAAALGVEARFEETEWGSLLSGVKAGRFDIICNGVGYTEERALEYEFSEPYVYTRKVLIVSSDNDTINAFEDLAGKTTANSPNSTYATYAEELGAKVEYIDTFGETITLLEQGRIDATINSEVSYLDYMRQHPDAKIRIADQSEGESVCYPVKKGETDLCEAVNKALDDLRASGRLAELSEQFFGGDITNK